MSATSPATWSAIAPITQRKSKPEPWRASAVESHLIQKRCSNGQGPYQGLGPRGQRQDQRSGRQSDWRRQARRRRQGREDRRQGAKRLGRLQGCGTRQVSRRHGHEKPGLAPGFLRVRGACRTARFPRASGPFAEVPMIIDGQESVTTAVLAEFKRAPDARLREIMSALVRHLHDFAREVRLTEAEFERACAYIAALGHKTTASHNEVVLMAGSLG